MASGITCHTHSTGGASIWPVTPRSQCVVAVTPALNCHTMVQVLGADGLLYQSVEDLLSVAQSLNPDIQNFEASCFTGV